MHKPEGPGTRWDMLATCFYVPLVVWTSAAVIDWHNIAMRQESLRLIINVTF